MDELPPPSSRYPLVNHVQKSERLAPHRGGSGDGIVGSPARRGRRACAGGKPMAFSAVIHSLTQPMPHRGNFFHLHLVSDATGKIVFRQELDNLPAGTSVQRLGLQGRTLPAGTYFVSLEMPGGKLQALQILKLSK